MHNVSSQNGFLHRLVLIQSLCSLFVFMTSLKLMWVFYFGSTLCFKFTSSVIFCYILEDNLFGIHNPSLLWSTICLKKHRTHLHGYLGFQVCTILLSVIKSFVWWKTICLWQFSDSCWKWSFNVEYQGFFFFSPLKGSKMQKMNISFLDIKLLYFIKNIKCI